MTRQKAPIPTALRVTYLILGWLLVAGDAALVVTAASNSWHTPAPFWIVAVTAAFLGAATIDKADE